MRELTVIEFNKEFGVNTWGYERYKMVSADDVDTFVSQKLEGQTIPYFCEWLQTDTYEEMCKQHLSDVHGTIIKIIEKEV